MKRTLCLGALLLISAMTAACGFKIFEDVGSDPHPPTVEPTKIEVYVPPPPETPAASAASPNLRSIPWDSGGFTLAAGQLFKIGVAYTDAGADILKFTLRDRDGKLFQDLTPTAQTYFTGTSGTAFGPDAGIAITGVVGRHRLELWAEDSHGSRSEKVEFVITLTL